MTEKRKHTQIPQYHREVSYRFNLCLRRIDEADIIAFLESMKGESVSHYVERLIAEDMARNGDYERRETQGI